MNDESTFLYHTSCPSCGSKDNLAVYSNGSYCFGCNYTEKGGEDNQPKKKGKTVANLIDGEYRALTKRGLSEDSCRKFGYQVGEHKGKPVQIAPYFDQDGALVAQKIRTPDKDFFVLGDLKQAGLFGQHLWGSKGKMVVVCEGEIDALSVSQLQNNKWPVVSVPNGASGAKKSLAKNIEWLNSFESVILMFDNDEPGREASIACAELFSAGKCKIASLPLKDANEMLVAGRGQEVISAIWNAKPYRPDGIMTFGELKDLIRKPVELGLSWPWEELTNATYGRRTGEVYMLGAGTGVGKTDWFTQVVMHTVQQGEKCGLFFLEQDPVETGKRVAGKLAKRRFHIPDSGWSESELEAAVDALDKTQSIYIYNSWGATEWSVVASRIEFMAHSEGVKHFFVDHLTALAANQPSEKDALEEIMAGAATLAKRLNVCLYMISHLTTPEKGSHEEGARVTIRQFKGSRAIGFWAHFILGMERDQQSDDEDERRLTRLRILKDRYTGKSTGLVIPMGFDDETGLYYVMQDNPFNGDEVDDIPF